MTIVEGLQNRCAAPPHGIFTVLCRVTANMNPRSYKSRKNQIFLLVRF